MSLEAWFVALGLSSLLVYYQLTWLFLDDLPGLYIAINSLFLACCIYFLLLGNKYPFSLYHCFYLFYLLFFGLTPPMEMYLGAIYWGAPQTVFSQYELVTFLALLSLFVFHYSYRLSFTRKSRRTNNSPSEAETGKDTSSPLILLLLSMFGFASILYFNNFSYISVLFRGGELVDRIDLGQIWNLIYSQVIFPIPCVALVVYLQSPSSKRNALVTLVLLVIFVLANPATGMARWKAAAFYIAVLVSFFPMIMNYRFLMVTLLSVGLLFIFPILNNFRNYAAGASLFEFDSSFIYAGHFDTFQSFANAVDQSFISYGYQLLGALFFFVPRSYWPTKPVGSGTEMAGQNNFTFDNISMNFLAEGYVNFGFPGIFLFAAFAGFAIARLDFSFRNTPRYGSSATRIFSIFMVGLVFFILRGDLLSSTAYATGLFISIFLIVKLSRGKLRKMKFRG